MTLCLIDWAETQFWQDKQVNGHGITQAAVLRHIEKVTGQNTGLIPEATLPDCVSHVWDWFLLMTSVYADRELSPSSWRANIQALVGLDPRPWEIQALMAITHLWLKRQTSTS